MNILINFFYNFNTLFQTLVFRTFIIYFINKLRILNNYNINNYLKYLFF